MFNLFLTFGDQKAIILEKFNTSIIDKKFYKEIFKFKNLIQQKNINSVELLQYCNDHGIDKKIFKCLYWYSHLTGIDRTFFLYFSLEIYPCDNSIINKLKLLLVPIIKIYIYFF